MIDRNCAVKALRSEIVTEAIQTNANQLFQDSTLRPILKFQHHTIITLFHEFVVSNKINFDHLTLTQRNYQIEMSLKKNQRLQSLLKGIVIGLFDELELKYWFANKEEVNKRIQQLLIKRIQRSYNPSLI
jgi:hypothetical protein